MNRNWLKARLITFAMLIHGKLLKPILTLLNYNSFHSPIKQEISELLARDFKAQPVNNLICVKAHEGYQTFLLRPNTSDKHVFYQVIEKKEYSPLIDLIEMHKAQNTIAKIIDAGSNIGLTSLFFKQYYPDCKIVSIEPDPNNQLHQIQNININNYSDSILTINKALWKNTTDQLSLSSDFRDGQYWSKSVKVNNDGRNLIATTTLSNVIKEHFQNQIVDILKIDIEGSESILFQNIDFVTTLIQKVRFLSIEIHDEFDCRQDILSTLKASNFSVLSLGETTFCVNQSLVL